MTRSTPLNAEYSCITSISSGGKLREFHVWFHNRNRTPSSYVVVWAVAAPATTAAAFVPAPTTDAAIGDAAAVTNIEEDKDAPAADGIAAEAAAFEAEEEEEDDEEDDDDDDDDDKDNDDDTNFGMVDTCCSCIRSC